jgi:hypothetical protein
MRPNQSDNGYSGGEDRRKIIRQWLREQEQDRESREKHLTDLDNEHFGWR